MLSAQKWARHFTLLLALIWAAVAGVGTSHADTAPADRNYAGRPHMGLMDPAPSTVPVGTGGIKPVRPVKPIPRPRPKPRPVADPTLVDPNIIGYAADGTPIYPWGPRPLPPKPIKDMTVEPIG